MRKLAVSIARILGSGLCAAPLAFAQHAAAPPLASCAIPRVAEALQGVKQLPPAVQAALLRDAGEQSPIGGPFDATDVVMGTPHFQRLIFLWHYRQHWLIATERGGIAYSTPLYLYELSKDSKQTTRIPLNSPAPGNVCAAAQTSLLR